MLMLLQFSAESCIWVYIRFITLSKMGGKTAYHMHETGYL